jgi:exosortase/archaeosortase family protein
MEMQKPARPGIDYLPDNFVPPPPKPWPLWLQLVVFAFLFIAMQAGWSLAQGTPLEHVTVGDWTVKPAAFWIRLITPAIGASAQGYSITAVGGGINVMNGCEGFEVIFLWVAALAVTPISWRWRAIGLVLGIASIWVLNQLRILVLFYAYRTDREWFAQLHGTIAPLVLIVLVASIFALFVMRASGPNGASHSEGTGNLT